MNNVFLTGRGRHKYKRGDVNTRPRKHDGDRRVGGGTSNQVRHDGEGNTSDQMIITERGGCITSDHVSMMDRAEAMIAQVL